MKITIETSCGQTFELTPAEMSDHQLRGLIEQNPDHEATPLLIAELAQRTDGREK